MKYLLSYIKKCQTGTDFLVECTYIISIAAYSYIQYFVYVCVYEPNKKASPPPNQNDVTF